MNPQPDVLRNCVFVLRTLGAFPPRSHKDIRHMAGAQNGTPEHEKGCFTRSVLEFCFWQPVKQHVRKNIRCRKHGEPMNPPQPFRAFGKPLNISSDVLRPIGRDDAGSVSKSTGV